MQQNGTENTYVVHHNTNIPHMPRQVLHHRHHVQHSYHNFCSKSALNILMISDYYYRLCLPEDERGVPWCRSWCASAHWRKRMVINIFKADYDQKL